MLLPRLRAFHVALFIGGWLLVVGCTGAIADEPLIPGAKTVLPIFQPIVQQLRTQTQIPIVLPTQIPTDALVALDDSGRLQPYINVPITTEGKFENVFAYVLSSAKDSYTLTLDATSDCQGANVCSFGMLTARQVYQDTPPLAQDTSASEPPDYLPMARSPESAGEVQLIGGITGYFIPYSCGANCNTSDVIWEQNGYRYSVGVRMASQAAVVRMANSAIRNEL